MWITRHSKEQFAEVPSNSARSAKRGFYHHERRQHFCVGYFRECRTRSLHLREKAVELSRQAAELDPVNPAVRSYRAFALLSVQRFEEAKAEFRRVAELNPLAPWGHAGVSQCLSMQGRFDEAGFLGSRYRPFATGGNPAQTPFAVEGIVLPGFTEQRQKNRRERR